MAKNSFVYNFNYQYRYFATFEQLLKDGNITLSGHFTGFVFHLVKKFLSSFGISLIRNEKLDDLYSSLDKANSKIKWMATPDKESINYFVQNNCLNSESKSQLQQDLVALFVHSLFSNDPGYFVEFGATDGRSYSNTYSLEKSFRWSGILAEPATTWHRELAINRSCEIDYRCVWSSDGESLLFNEVNEAEYSTVESFSNSDYHTAIRRKGHSYFVQTVMLETLLREHEAPKVISYLSVDTEGSELEILQSFNFDAYKFNFISVEHNYSENRTKVHELLVQNGYERVLPSLSEWDDWYVRRCPETVSFLEVANA